MRARRSESCLLTVIAKSTLECPSIFLIALHHAERTSDYAIGASIANIRLYVNAAKFSSDDGTGRTSFQASRILTVFANVGGKRP
jgi:hypothetical protein